MGWEVEVIDNCNHKETQFVCLRRENIDYILGRECIKYHKNNNNNNDNASVLVDIYSQKDTFISKKLLVCKVINNGTLTCYIKNNLQSVICDMECVSKDENKIEKYVLRVTDSLNIFIADEKYNIKIYYIDEKKLKENSLSIDNSSLSKGVSISIDDFFKKNNNNDSIYNSKKGKQNLNHEYNDVSIEKNKLVEQVHSQKNMEENSSNKKSLNHDLDSLQKMINGNDDDIKPVVKEEVKKIKRDTTKSSEKRQEKEQKEKSLATTLFNIKMTNESSSSQAQHDSIIEDMSINTKSFKIDDKSEKLKLNKEIENSKIHKTNYKKFKRRNGSIIKPELVNNIENNFKKQKVSMSKYVDANIPKFKTMKDLKIDINNKKKDANYNKCLFLDD